MNYELYSRVAINSDIENTIFKKGDIGTIVEIINNSVELIETGYCLEMFDALGNTIDVIVVSEQQLQALSEKNILHLREFELVAEV
ncbi:MAG: hypothetical protein HW421_1729 [Ignavibacteria bacterium]|nr:hypothetical protein [Ignavibacteria bacterium]